MKRPTNQILRGLRQLDPERPSAPVHDQRDPELNDVSDRASEMMLLRILATPRTVEGADNGMSVREGRASAGRRGNSRNIRSLGIVVGAVALIGLVLGIVISTGGKTSTGSKISTGGKVSTRGKTPVRVATPHSSSPSALHPILTALTSTTAAENYAFDYSTRFQPGTTGANSGAPTTSP